VSSPAQRRFGSRPGLGGKLGNFALDLVQQSRDVETGFLKQRAHHAFVLVQQGGKQVGVVGNRIAPPGGIGGGFAKGLLGLDGQSFCSDHWGIFSLGPRDGKRCTRFPCRIDRADGADRRTKGADRRTN
jgi:hypothetical protein